MAHIRKISASRHGHAPSVAKRLKDSSARDAGLIGYALQHIRLAISAVASKTNRIARRKRICYAQFIVRNMQLGRAIVLIPENQQLTTQRAADLLGVSRPHLIKLLGTGELPYHKVGSHRRIYLKDLLGYQRRRDMERKAALDRIAREAFESGLYDRTGIPEGGEDE